MNHSLVCPGTMEIRDEKVIRVELFPAVSSQAAQHLSVDLHLNITNRIQYVFHLYGP